MIGLGGLPFLSIEVFFFFGKYCNFEAAAAGADFFFSTGRSFFSTGRSFRFNIAAISLSFLQRVGFGGKTL
jgi:hypothetical protein